jgi:AraC-like DNA-binding protein
MPTALICYEGQGGDGELIRSLSDLKGWEILLNRNDRVDDEETGVFLQSFSLHFLIYCKELELKAFQELNKFHKEHPFISIIYYNAQLINRQFMQLSQVGINSCIIGSKRRDYLRNNLPKLWEKHWKRIPEDIFPIQKVMLPPRAKKILRYIENHALHKFEINSIADYLRISPSHLRAEFKNYFGVNFREFKKRLLCHYESILLLEKNYKPNNVYKLLNYSNLANLSRSFKTRHGNSWRCMNNENATSFN